MSRIITFALIAVLAVSTLFAILPAQADIPAPSVPEFTVKIVDHSYDTPPTTPTYAIDPYTGEQKQVSSGSASHHIEKKSIEITIKNQPFTPYDDSDGHHIGLFFNFRFKGHYGTDWAYDPFKPDDVSSKIYGGWDMTYLIPYSPSDSEYTIVQKDFSYFGTDHGQVDFQVQAQIGYIQAMGSTLAARVWGIPYNFTGQSSPWSNTQTITLTENAVTPLPTSTPTPTAPWTQTQNSNPSPIQSGIQIDKNLDFDWEKVAISGLIVVITVLATALVLSRRKKP